MRRDRLASSLPAVRAKRADIGLALSGGFFERLFAVAFSARLIEGTAEFDSKSA